MVERLHQAPPELFKKAAEAILPPELAPLGKPKP